MNPETTADDSDPFQVLDIPLDASEAEVRSRYLELVKKFPPEQDPNKFREIQMAYEAARDPLVLAHRLIQSSGDEDVPSWQAVIDRVARQAPRMSVPFLLSLGNQPAGYKAAESSKSASEKSDSATLDASPPFHPSPDSPPLS